MSSVQIEEGGSDEKGGGKKTEKIQILEEVRQVKRKANNDPTYSTTPSFDWADDVDASIIPIDTMHHEPAPAINVNASVDPFPAERGTYKHPNTFALAAHAPR